MATRDVKFNNHISNVIGANSAWSDKVALNWTPRASRPYVVLWSASGASATTATQTKMRLTNGSTVYGEYNIAPKDVTDLASYWGLALGPTPSTSPDTATYTVQVSSSTTTSATSAVGAIAAIELADDDIFLETTPLNGSTTAPSDTTYTTLLNTNLVVPENGTYLFAYSSELSSINSGRGVLLKLTDDGGTTIETSVYINVSNQWFPGGAILARTMTAGTHSFVLGMRGTSTNTATARNTRLLIMRLTGTHFDTVQSASFAGTSASQSQTSATVRLTLNATNVAPGDWLLLQSGYGTQQSQTGSGLIRYTEGGVDAANLAVDFRQEGRGGSTTYSLPPVHWISRRTFADSSGGTDRTWETSFWLSSGSSPYKDLNTVALPLGIDIVTEETYTSSALSLSATPALSASGITTRIQFSLSLNTTPGLNASGTTVRISPALSLSRTQTLNASATTTRTVSANLSTSPNLSASGNIIEQRSGSASLTATPVLSSVLTTARIGSGSLAAVPVTAVQTNTARFGASSQSLVPVLVTATTTGRTSGTLNATAFPSLAVQTTTVHTGVGILNLSGDLTGNGSSTRIANAAIASGAILTALGGASEGAFGSASLVSVPAFSVSITSTRSVSVGLTTNPVLAAQAQSVRTSSGTILASSNIVPVSTTIRFNSTTAIALVSSFAVTGAASVEEYYTGSTILDIAPILDITGTTTRTTTADLSVSPTLAVSALQTRTSGAVSFAASAILATQVTVVRSGVGATNLAPTLATNATSVRIGSATLSLTTGSGGYSGGFSGGFDTTGSGGYSGGFSGGFNRSQTSITLTATGLVFEGFAGSAGIISTPSLTVTAVTTRISTGTLESPVTLSAQTASIRFGSGSVGLSPNINAGSATTVRTAAVTITATSVLTGAGTTVRTTSVSISSSPAVSASATSLRFGAASLASDPVVFGTGTAQELVSRSAALEITPVLTGTVFTVRIVSFNFDIAADLTGSAITTRPTDITVPAAVAVSAIGIRGVGGAATVNAEPTFSVVATSTHIAAATATASPVLTGSSTTLRSGSATLVDTSSIVVSGAPQEHISRSASLSAAPTINLGVQPGHTGTASIAASPAISVEAVATNRPVAVMVSAVTATSATYSLVQEDAYIRAANISASVTVTVGSTTADHTSATVTGSMGPAALTVVVSRTSESSANLPGASALTVVAITHRIAPDLTEDQIEPVVSGIGRTVRISTVALVGIPVLVASGDAAENLRVAHISLQGAVNDVVPLSGLRRKSVGLSGVYQAASDLSGQVL